MKIFNYKSILATIFLSLMGTVELFAKNSDNPPAPRGSGGFDNGGVVGSPIDDYLPLLFFAALMLGVWALNRLTSKELVKVKS